MYTQLEQPGGSILVDPGILPAPATTASRYEFAQTPEVGSFHFHVEPVLNPVLIMASSD